MGVFCFVLDTFFVPLLCTKNTRTDGWLKLVIVFVELFMVMDWYGTRRRDSRGSW